MNKFDFVRYFESGWLNAVPDEDPFYEDYDEAVNLGLRTHFEIFARKMIAWELRRLADQMYAKGESEQYTALHAIENVRERADVLDPFDPESQ